MLGFSRRALLVGLGMLGGCAAEEHESVAPAAVAQTPVQVPAKFELRMRQTACFGSCPVYELELDASGALSFDGHEYTVVHGTRTGFVPPERVGAVVRELERADRSSLGLKTARGCMVVRDESAVIVEGVLDGREVVLNSGDSCDPRHAAPLFRLAERVLDLTSARPWVHPIPRCEWRVDRVAARALVSNQVGVATDADGLAASVAAAYADHRATRVRLVSRRRPGESRREARERAQRMADLLSQHGLSRGGISLGVERAVAGDEDTALVVALESTRCPER